MDNASTDDTYRVASELAATVAGVAAMHLPRKGRGYALRSAWSTSEAPVVAYMDVDLSTSLSALLPLVAPLLSGHRDVTIGSRLARGAHVVRGPKRELISRAYNLILKLTLRGRFSDAQCGFKALRRDAAEKLLPLVEDNEWFFDTELLVTAERLGLRIGEVPVDWVDDPDSRVHIVSTAADDLRGVWRMLVRRPKGLRRMRSNEVAADQLLRFAGVGRRSRRSATSSSSSPGARSSGRSPPTPSRWRSPLCSTPRCTASSPAPPTARPGAAASSPWPAGSTP